mmetsp:Transcript_32905/g.72437  ORF Transcript_32905/g.72437 Transcript_32905/m.72437 type:complete len:326 (-) Transcript_32905:331-1308(-)
MHYSVIMLCAYVLEDRKVGEYAINSGWCLLKAALFCDSIINECGRVLSISVDLPLYVCLFLFLHLPNHPCIHPSNSGRGGMKGGAKVIIEAHRHEGVFIARSKEDALVTLNSTPGKDVYGEKRIQVEGPVGADGAATKLEYRVWNPFRSKLAAAILGGVDNIYMGPGSKVLYIGASAGTTVSHVSDIVGPTGVVYAVEFAHRPGRDLINMAKSRTNVIPIIEDARHPLKYRMLMGMVDTIFADVAQPDQARIVALNAQYFLKQGGHFVLSIKASCIDSTAPAEAVFAREVKKLQEENLKPQEQLTLEPYERDHAVVVGIYRPTKK